MPHDPFAPYQDRPARGAGDARQRAGQLDHDGAAPSHLNDVRAFARVGHQHPCVVIKDVILIKGARLLVDWIKQPPESGPSPAIS